MKNIYGSRQRFDHFAHGDGSNQPASVSGNRFHPSSADEAVRALGDIVDVIASELDRVKAELRSLLAAIGKESDL